MAAPYRYGSIGGDADEEEESRSRHEQHVRERFQEIRMFYPVVFIAISICLLILTTGKRHWVAKEGQGFLHLAEGSAGTHPPAPFTLTLMGDELLLGNPERQHQLTSRLGLRVYHETGVKLSTHVHIYSGIGDMSNDIEKVLREEPADGIVLMLHNDLSLYRGMIDSPENIERARLATLSFQDGLEAILNTVNTSFPSTRVCLCGPGLVGEHGPLFRPSWDTDLMQRKVSEYREICMQAHRSHPKVYYIDLNHALRDSLLVVWPFWSGWLTHGDGQTLNTRGTGVEARLLGELMLRYYSESVFEMATDQHKEAEIETEVEAEEIPLVDELQ